MNYGKQEDDETAMKPAKAVKINGKARNAGRCDVSSPALALGV
jgi:hypothetical protein